MCKPTCNDLYSPRRICTPTKEVHWHRDWNWLTNIKCIILRYRTWIIAMAIKRWLPPLPWKLAQTLKNTCRMVHWRCDKTFFNVVGRNSLPRKQCLADCRTSVPPGLVNLGFRWQWRCGLWIDLLDLLGLLGYVLLLVFFVRLLRGHLSGGRYEDGKNCRGLGKLRRPLMLLEEIVRCCLEQHRGNKLFKFVIAGIWFDTFRMGLYYLPGLFINNVVLVLLWTRGHCLAYNHSSIS